MAWLPFFADEHDLRVLIDRLNDDPEIAFIVPDGLVHPEASDTGSSQNREYRRRWKAVQRIETLADGEHQLWHVLGGPLPLVPETCGATLESWRTHPTVVDPWSGWIEERPSGYSGPWFGVRAPSVIRLTLWTRVSPYTPAEQASLIRQVSYWTGSHDLLVASDFQFGGKLSAATPQTLRWWSGVKRWLPKAAARLQPSSSNRSSHFWAFPSALRRLKAGTPYSASNWNLDASIRDA